MLSSVNYYICFTALLYKLLACLAPRVWNYWQLSGLVDHESLFLFINFIKCIIKRLFIVTDLYAWIFDILTSNLTDLIGKNDCLSLVSLSWQSHERTRTNDNDISKFRPNIYLFQIKTPVQISHLYMNVTDV